MTLIGTGTRPDTLGKRASNERRPPFATTRAISVRDHTSVGIDGEVGERAATGELQFPAEQLRHSSAGASDDAVRRKEHRHGRCIVDDCLKQRAVAACDLPLAPVGDVTHLQDDALNALYAERSATPQFDEPIAVGRVAYPQFDRRAHAFSRTESSAVAAVGTSSGWIRSMPDRPTISARSQPSCSLAARFAHTTLASPSTTTMMSGSSSSSTAASIEATESTARRAAPRWHALTDRHLHPRVRAFHLCAGQTMVLTTLDPYVSACGSLPIRRDPHAETGPTVSSVGGSVLEDHPGGGTTWGGWTTRSRS